jgi:hypothetical protein
VFSEFFLICGITSPGAAFCAARDHDTRRDPHAKFCVNDAQRAAVAAASGDAIGGL